ncbi:UV DNA damage repair endonuclease UvsE [Paenibacillus sp. Leaf72]|uniref:UV DNA damage repair endonuclease UvsE n=1 Tax=Paenibacillus sp. Leaf72 TaxID=1736234 RepID=UPI0006F7A202|nr:UV DNA damage repair endonuclease UvsE [Paenibacillus sp. Leaf72]KQO18179.1 UV damage endonuclease UvdE [Paenibacillus sp. Leaf72]
MLVRFGFVAMSMLLENASPSRTMTFANFTKLGDREAALRKLERIAEDNLHSTLRILKHAKASDIQMYRFSSKLIPLATHQDVADWDAYPALREAFREIGLFVQNNRLRVSFHPDHFCVFSTPRPEVLESSKRDMEYHVRMLEAMGLPESVKCNIHIGGAYGDKMVAGARFIRQFHALPERYRHRVTLENDDKTFNAVETLEAAQAVEVPMVLDVHHHQVNDGGVSLDKLCSSLWPQIAETWLLEEQRLNSEAAEAADGAEKMSLPPKIHFSSPKEGPNPRSHADYLNAGELLLFLRKVAAVTPQLDCMLEAKLKDKALLALMDDFRILAARGEGVRIVDGGSIEVTEL